LEEVSSISMRGTGDNASRDDRDPVRKPYSTNF